MNNLKLFSKMSNILFAVSFFKLYISSIYLRHKKQIIEW
jgi:hypothetical protein